MTMDAKPPELLIHILSFLPQRELVSSIQHVCDYFEEISFSPELWREIQYNIVYQQTPKPLIHFYHVQRFVKNLVIHAKDLAIIFNYHRKIKLPNLESLLISTHITDGMWEILISENFVEMFPNLKSLSLFLPPCFNIDVCLNAMKKFNLNSFSIGNQAHTSVDGALMSFISSQIKLQQLTFMGNIRISNDTIATIINEYPNITKIKFGPEQNISDLVFTSSTSPITWTSLEMTSDRLKDKGLESLVGRSPYLSTLHIENCRNITNRGLQTLSSCGEVLQELSIAFPRKKSHLCNETLQRICAGCHRLRYFSAIGCTLIDSSGVLELVSSCKELKGLNLTQCGNITDEMVLSIGNCKMLKYLWLHGGVDISLNSVIILLKSCSLVDVGIVLESTFKYHTNYEHSTKNSVITAATDFRSSSTDSEKCHSHVKSLDIFCNRDVTKENILRLVEVCTDTRKFNLDCMPQLTGIDDIVLSELFNKCVFLSKVSLNNTSFDRI